MTINQQINSHPAFQMKCLCNKHPHRFQISKPGTETRVESMCSVCAAQLEALGYKTTMVG